MSLSASIPLTGSQGSGGSNNSAQSSSNYVSDSWSRTYGSEATAKSYAEAIRATQRQQEFFDQTKAYNSREAYAQRAFNEMMGNTIYTRSVKNMIEAGINPILAANMGLSGAQVNSGAAASVSTPSAFMGQTFADQVSGSHAESSSQSSSSGSGWNNSESGLATGLAQLGKYFAEGLSSINSALNLDINLKGFKEAEENLEDYVEKTNPEGKKTSSGKTVPKDFNQWNERTQLNYMLSNLIPNPFSKK